MSSKNNPLIWVDVAWILGITVMSVIFIFAIPSLFARFGGWAALPIAIILVIYLATLMVITRLRNQAKGGRKSK